MRQAPGSSPSKYSCSHLSSFSCSGSRGASSSSSSSSSAASSSCARPFARCLPLSTGVCLPTAAAPPLLLLLLPLLLLIGVGTAEAYGSPCEGGRRTRPLAVGVSCGADGAASPVVSAGVLSAASVGTLDALRRIREPVLPPLSSEAVRSISEAMTNVRAGVAGFLGGLPRRFFGGPGSSVGAAGVLVAGGAELLTTGPSGVKSASLLSSPSDATSFSFASSSCCFSSSSSVSSTWSSSGSSFSRA